MRTPKTIEIIIHEEEDDVVFPDTFYEDSEITITESNSKAHREMLQLERKLQYVSSFSAVKEGIDYDLDGEVYDVFGDNDIDGEAMCDDINDRISLSESVDGVALDI